MKKILLSAGLVLACVFTGNAQDNLVNSLKVNQSDSAKAKFQFTTVLNVECSPVKTKVARVLAGAIRVTHFSKVK